MTSLNRKIAAEVRMRQLLEDGELPMPDEVEYGEGCIRLLWHDKKLVVVVDLDEDTP